MNIELVKKHIGEQVKTGVPHNEFEGRLFWYFGILKSVEDDNTLVIETRDGVIFVDISQVKQFQVDNQRTVG